MKFLVSSRQSGKTLIIEKALAEYVKANPDVTIVRYQNGQAIIEKPVKQVVRKLIEAKE